MSRLSIVIPVHNDGAIIKETLKDLITYVSQIELSPIAFIFIENGSQDNSAQILSEILQNERLDPRISLLVESISKAGIGYAYQRGIDIALERFGDKDHWIMLTASDLPFGSSDLEQFTKELKNNAKQSIFIGSKANLASRVERGIKRWLAGKIFYLLRKTILGMRTGDPQGVFFLKAELISLLAPKVLARNFFYTTELTYYAEKKGEQIVELPVVYQGERRASSVRVFRHGIELIKNIIKLRLRTLI